ncbi:FecR family protein [Olivibacter sp. XZL3]|uniref:FecR family protein n=1 Tax=Olivibacter sp. XZL3 TaxID=1735116 RepID=UPI001064A46D|nr:FecR domain-containing protein [Olivibacter sp. XZL3]
MEDKLLRELIEKYMNGTATREETKRLLDWYQKVNAEENIWHEEESEEHVHGRILSGIQKRMGEKTIIKKKRLLQMASVASIILALGIGLFAYFHYASIGADIREDIPLTATENRYVVLPDSSLVLLRPGSEIHYNKKDFNNVDRQVRLIGEAYFDVRQRAGKPFIILTDQMKVRVLGTSFTVKAYPEQQNIVVNVKEGKIQMESDQNDLAILTAGQQAIYSKREKSILKNKLAAAAPENWIARDMIFDATPFRELADRLENRYKVKIAFKNPALEKCPITGKFTGTEPLSLVLKIINQTRGTDYTIRGRTIEIDGEGCN